MSVAAIIMYCPEPTKERVERTTLDKQQRSPSTRFTLL